jgi:hypothetical protein
MRDAVAGVPVAVARRALGHGHFALTALGRALLDRHGAELYPHEAAMLMLLRDGASAAALLDVGGNSARAIRALHAFKLLEAIAAPAPARRPYALLLRKQRQLRRRAPSHVLLETREDASPAESRRALRRLAVALHPDRFGEGTPPPIRRASTEVLAALLRAEREKE